MDRIVWVIVVTVAASFFVECSGVRAQAKDSRQYGSVAAQYQLPNRIPNDVELIDPVQASGTVNNQRAARIQMLDNIFRVSESA